MPTGEIKCHFRFREGSTKVLSLLVRSFSFMLPLAGHTGRRQRGDEHQHPAVPASDGGS